MKVIPERNKFFRYARTYLPLWREKQIGFYENFGHGDLGDDAAFYVAQELLGESLMPISKRCYSFYPNALKGLLIGGRGVFHWKSPYIPSRIFDKKKWEFPVVLLAAGVNCDYDQNVSENTKDLVKRLCERCDYVSVRDFASQRFLNDLGVRGVNILPDLELAVLPQKKIISCRKGARCVGITVTPHSAFGVKVFKKIVSNFIDFVKYLTDKGYQVVFLPFDNSSSDSNKEGTVIKEIIKNIPRKNQVFFLNEDFSPGEMLFTMASLCDFMVCMRLHSMVFATNAGIPFLPINFNHMHSAFLDMVDMSDYGISLFEGFSLDSLVTGFDRIRSRESALKTSLESKTAESRKVIYKTIADVKNVLKI